MEDRALKTGAVIHNRYRIVKVLGAGGFGVTYQVVDQRDGRAAAMKEYFPADMARREPLSLAVLPDPEKGAAFEKFREKFLGEAKIIYRYQGTPDIIDVFHLFRENNTAYYVMELLDGMDLKRYLDQHGQRLPWPELRRIFSQVVQALGLLHRDGLIHCDISPDNIFLCRSGQVKLIDFGAAKNTAGGQASCTFMKRGFAPLEQQWTSYGPMGPWTDIYALAVTVYLCCTGQLPPQATDRIKVDKTIWPAQLGFAPPTQNWELALKKAMALHPGDRYQTVEDFWFELNRNFSSCTPVLRGVQGLYQGARIPIQGEVLLGTDARCCSILYPIGAPGISRRHLRIWEENGQTMVVDLGSSYGTWLDGCKLIPGCARRLTPGKPLELGNGQRFRLLEPK